MSTTQGPTPGAPPAEVVYDDRGLVPAVAQDALTGQVRMVAWMSREALATTIATGKATFFSRSRGRLWTKGETSGNTLAVTKVFYDCDADTLLLLVRASGPSCHTGRPSCFFRTVGDDGELHDEPTDAAPVLLALEDEIARRATSASAEKSYTKSLLDAGAPKIGDKIREEADELARAIASETDDRVASEAADLVYHALVGLRLRGVPLSDVLAVLAKRAGTSGLVEKASRT